MVTSSSSSQALQTGWEPGVCNRSFICSFLHCYSSHSFIVENVLRCTFSQFVLWFRSSGFFAITSVFTCTSGLFTVEDGKKWGEGGGGGGNKKKEKQEDFLTVQEFIFAQ